MQFITTKKSNLWKKFSFTLACSITINNLEVGKRHIFKITFWANTSNNLIYCRFNNDSGNNYRRSALIFDYTGVTAGGDSSDTDRIYCQHGSYNNIIDLPAFLEAELIYAYNNNKKVLIQGILLSNTYDTSRQSFNHFTGRYIGASDVSSITFYTTAGGMTGKIEVYKE